MSFKPPERDCSIVIRRFHGLIRPCGSLNSRVRLCLVDDRPDETLGSSADRGHHNPIGEANLERWTVTRFHSNNMAAPCKY
jgi:hypothetical protein